MRSKNKELKDVWQTPNEIIEMLGTIHTDPCAGENTSIGELHNFTEKDNGLSQKWKGNVFVNPPFTQKSKWLNKAVNERDNTNCIFVLTPDSTDTKSWWHKYVSEYADYIWFSKGRISYINPDTGEKGNSPTFGTAISIFGEPDKKVLKNMSDKGQLVKNVTF